jgi:hypothetical protein
MVQDTCGNSCIPMKYGVQKLQTGLKGYKLMRVILNILVGRKLGLTFLYSNGPRYLLTKMWNGADS